MQMCITSFPPGLALTVYTRKGAGGVCDRTPVQDAYRVGQNKQTISDFPNELYTLNIAFSERAFSEFRL